MNCPSKKRDTLTYTALKTFRNCRRMYELRYGRCLAPLEENRTLFLGSVFHECLEKWYTRKAEESKEKIIDAILDFVDASYPNRRADDLQRKNWHLARAMFLGYVERYPTEDFEVVHIEKEFRQPIRNPRTGRVSRSFEMAGKADGVVKKEGAFWLLETKTAASVDGAYLEKLPLDAQVSAYCHFLGEELGVPIRGVVYNIALKSQLRQRQGETEEEFENRRAALAAKSKTGRSNAKRQEPESDEAFQKRLAEWYRRPEAFHRELLFIGDDQVDLWRHEIWDLSQEILRARRANVWPLNTDHCFGYGHKCAYWELCRSRENPVVLQNFFREAPPHQELSGVSKESEETIF